MAGVPDKLKSVQQHNLSMIALAAARQPQSPQVVLGCSDFKIYQVDPRASKLTLKEIGKHDSYVTGLAISGDTLISGGYDGRLNWWALDKVGAPLRSVEAHTRWIRNVAVSPSGLVVASVADDMACKLHDVKTGRLLHDLRGHKERTPNHFPSMLYACAFSRDGKLLATGDKVGHIVIWDVASGKEVSTLESPGMYTWDGRQRIHSIGGIRSLAFSPDGKQLAVGGIGKIGNIDHLEGPARVEVFDLASGKSTHLFEKMKFKGLINRLTFDPQGNWLLGAGGAGNGVLVFLDLKKNAILKEENVKFHVHGMLLNDACDSVVAAGHHGLAVYEFKS